MTTPIKHGECVGGLTPEYNSLRGMIERCTNPRHSSFHLYGGRGITVCERWLGDGGVARFVADMGRRPSPRHSIDRIDGSMGYSPENCRWATAREQRANTRPRKSWARRVEAFGESKTVEQWSVDARCTVSRATISYRLSHGWTEHESVATPAGGAPRKTIGDRNGARVHPERRPRGASVKTAVLDEQRVAEMRARHADGASYRELAMAFGVAKTTVARVIGGVTWKTAAPTSL